MKRVAALIAVLIITHIPMSCCLDSCCGDDSGGLYNLKIIELYTVFGSYEPYYFSNEESTNYFHAGIRIGVNNFHSEKISLNLSFTMSRALACDPAITYAPSHHTNFVEITSSESVFFNGKEYLSGMNLIELFKIPNKNSTTANQFVNASKLSFWQFEDPYYEVILQLNDKPDTPMSQPLKIRIEFDDGAEVEVQTEPFVIE